ncbi:hypothetical protein EB796_008443 [Bugula neritina]|uniref:Uncharacterized protein n=1 Tax=Bugula neritina TaxID=10212 RepID=A0A7J7K3P9_BUGNE|nr:hypothetical protein EB796_008443 [Bugula neritina]
MRLPADLKKIGQLCVPNAEEYLIGCYIPSYRSGRRAKIPYRKTVNAKECILYCQSSSYMYANFKVKL